MAARLCDLEFGTQDGHARGFGVVKVTVNVTIIFPDVPAARGRRSLTPTQVQHVDQLLRQPWVRFLGEALATPVDGELEHFTSAGATGPNRPDSLDFH